MIILYILLVTLLIWTVYNGDVYPRVACLLAVIFIALQVAIFFLKLSVAWYIVTYVLLLIYLIVKNYGGDVKIR